MTAPQPVHVHPGEIIRWVDADTVILKVHLDYFHRGEPLWHRMLWIQAPERYTDAGKLATARVNELAPVGSRVIVRSFKEEGEKDNFGRWLAEIFVGDVSINQLLLQEGHAVPYRR